MALDLILGFIASTHNALLSQLAGPFARHHRAVRALAARLILELHLLQSAVRERETQLIQREKALAMAGTEADERTAALAARQVAVQAAEAAAGAKADALAEMQQKLSAERDEHARREQELSGAESEVGRLSCCTCLARLRTSIGMKRSTCPGRAGSPAEDSGCLVISSSSGDASLVTCLLQVRRARKELEILREDLESREKRAAVREARMQATDAEITSAHKRALQ